jgi:uncharacterized protein (DUF1800 family)
VFALPAPGVDADVLHVAKRLGYGPTPELMAEISEAGPHGWIDTQLAADAGQDDEVAAIAGFWPAAFAPAQEQDVGERRSMSYDMAAVKMSRAVWGRTPLRELMADFCYDHFNVDVLQLPEAVHVADYVETIVRPGAFGRFSDLLVQVARSGAMVNALDQFSSRADGGRSPNENYARELLELHTVGVDAGYGERDVKAVAHLFSGWGLDGAARTGSFAFDAARHDPGPFADPDFSVLGFSVDDRVGRAACEAFLAHLAAHPATRRRVCTKLVVRFVGEHAEESPLVDEAVDVWTTTDGDLGAVLGAILHSPAFFAAANRRVRRPFEFVAACLRATRSTIRDGRQAHFRNELRAVLSRMANVPYAWPAPDGYPDRDDFWLSAGGLAVRWDVAARIARGGLDLEADRDPVAHLTVAPTAEHLVRDITHVLLHEEPDLATLTAIAAAVEATSPSPTGWSRETTDLIAALVLASPQAQTR